MRRFIVGYVGCLKRLGGKLAILAWVAIAIVGGWKAPAFINGCSLRSTYIGTSPALEALHYLAELYPERGLPNGFTIMLVRSSPSANVTASDERVANFMRSAQHTLWDDPRAHHNIFRVDSPFLTTIGGDGPRRPVWFETPCPATYLSEDGHTAMLKVYHQVHAWGWIERRLLALNAEAGVSVSVTGAEAMQSDIIRGVIHDMALADAISFPLAVALLCYTLSSPRFFFLPICTIVCSLTAGFLIMLPITRLISVLPVALNLMSALSVALSVDYNLFFLARWREEVLKGKSGDDAVVISLCTSGHAIVVSGLTLGGCCLGLLLFPIDLIQSLGISASVICVTSVIVSLTLVPALLVTFDGCLRPNYIGHNYIGHNNIGHNYIGLSYMALTCKGHDSVGHNYIGP